MISTDKSSRRVLRLLFLTHFILSDPPYVCDESMTSAAVWRHPGSTRRLRASASCATVSELHRRLPYGAALNRRDDCIGIMHNRPRPSFPFPNDDIGCRMVPPVIDECIGIMHNRPQSVFLLRAITSVAVWNHQRARSKVLSDGAPAC